MFNGAKRRFFLFFVNALPVLKFFRMKRFLFNAIPGCYAGPGTRFVGKLILSNVDLRIGSNCFIGRDCAFYGNGSVDIGDSVDLAPGVSFFTGGHHVGSPERRAGGGFSGGILIGTGSWVGAKAILVNSHGDDLRIGRGCVIGAGSVVVRGAPDNVLVAGNPGIIKKALPE